MEEWLLTPLRANGVPGRLDALIEQMLPTLVAYRMWHERGTAGERGGLMELYRVGIVAARGDVERGSEAATETYLDVRGRLEGCVARAHRGRSVPDFRHPGEDLRRNAHRYHRLQLNFRLEGRWSVRREHAPIDEGLVDDEQWERPFQQAEDRTHALPLHFAGLWYHLDIREKRSRSGQLKDRTWWWSVLEHALELVNLGDLGSNRNDPTEALLRLQVRFAAARGLGRWLREWSRGEPYWQQTEFGLPDPAHPIAASTTAEALEALRPVLHEAIEVLSAGAAEKKALCGVLLRGENVRTALRRFEGSGTEAQRGRLFFLAEAAGSRASEVLMGDGGQPPEHHTGGGGGGGCPESMRVLMRELHAGEVPEVARLRTFQAHLSGCPDCQTYLASLSQADDYLPAIAAQPAPTAPRRAWLPAAAVLIAAVLIAVLPGILPTPDGPGDITLRGDPATAAVQLDLSVRRADAETTERFQVGTVYHPGDRIFFKVSADQADTTAFLWAQGPAGQERIGTMVAGEEPRFLEDGAVFYELEAPGTLTFSASPVGFSDCPERRCVNHEIVVKTP